VRESRLIRLMRQRLNALQLFRPFGNVDLIVARLFPERCLSGAGRFGVLHAQQELRKVICFPMT
jgi:hypothetical protein